MESAVWCLGERLRWLRKGFEQFLVMRDALGNLVLCNGHPAMVHCEGAKRPRFRRDGRLAEQLP